ncbi:MAG: extracellular solute-binding protein [Clostridia bacterium]|nr:extracellular solute-binding protein [Clostridia bacterium]
MRKLMAIMLALLLTGLTGCTGAEPAPDAASPEIPLRVWVGDNADIPWMEQVIADFKAAHPERTYRIEIGVQNEGDCAKVILSDVEAAADVFTFADDQMTSLLNAGALMPLQENAQSIRNANTPESVEAATGVDGQLYAYPATADNGYFLFYNTDYLSESDVQTFSGLLDKASDAGKKVAFPMANGWYFYSWFKGAGLDMHLSDDGVTNVCNWNAADTPITGAEVVQALLDISAHPGFIEADSDPFVAGLKDGSIIAGVSGTWNAAVAAESWGDSYAAAKLPTYTVDGQEVQMASFSGFKLVGVNAYSSYVGDAMDLAAFMTAKDAQLQRFRLRRQGPSNVEALSDPAVQAEPAIAAIIAQAPYATVQRVGSKYWDASAALGKIIVNGNPDSIDLQTLLDNCVAGITAPADQ